ncbi:MAG: emrA [Candidatus Eremiobacteraeota bacterium]|jgi:membrane fusion protein (multidrug efflux system)|nr:emrA [Candidatus Eremiobacteraeota bacterium]
MEARIEAPSLERPAAPAAAETGGPPPSSATAADPPAKHPRRRLAIVIGAIVVVAALIVGIRYLSFAMAHQTTDDAQVAADDVTVGSKISERVGRILVDTDQHVRRGQVIMLLDSKDEQNAVAQAQASFVAQREQARAARQTVLLTRTQVTAQTRQGGGGIVTAQSQIASARAQTQSAQQQAAAAGSAVVQAQAQFRAAQSQVPAARAALTRANADLGRYASLAQTGDVARQQLGAQRAAQAQAQAQYRSAMENAAAAQTSVAQAQARYTAALATENAAAAGIGAQQGQLQTAQGLLEQNNTPYRVSTFRAQADAAFAQANSLRAQLKTAQDRLNYTVIRSPIDGIVGEKYVEIGATVQPSQALILLVPEHGTYITANYKETQLGNVHPGQHVEINVDAYKGVKFTGHVAHIAPASQSSFSLIPAQNATGNFVKITQRIPVRILVDNPPADKPLRVGMSVETSILVK